MRTFSNPITHIIFGFVLAITLCIGNAHAVTISAGTGAYRFTAFDCSNYASMGATNGSAYYGKPQHTNTTTPNYSNDLTWFKLAYCNNANASVTNIRCAAYQTTQNATTTTYYVLVVADCPGIQSKVYIHGSSSSSITVGSATSAPSSGLSYISFSAGCSNPSCYGSWTTSSYTGYQQRPVYSALCNICTTTTTGNPQFRCASGYYGPTTQSSPTGCTKCTTTTGYSATSTPGSNTTVSNCTFSCASGYYGTATGASSGCTACVENATCNGGNNSTFTCNSGYGYTGIIRYGCQPCPANTATCNSTGMQCKAGYYAVKNGTPFFNTCTQCPPYGTAVPSDGWGTCGTVSSAIGSTSVNDCFMPKGVCTWTDANGNKFKTVQDCYIQ